jgi:hypothetical protein
VRRSEPRIDSSCCFSTAQESDSRSNVSLATQFFQQPARGYHVVRDQASLHHSLTLSRASSAQRVSENTVVT